MYEDYMPNYLNYPINNGYQNTYDGMRDCEYYNRSSYGYESFPGYKREMLYKRGVTSIDVEELYPDVYKIVYPMVRKACSENRNPISRDNIESMVDDIYSNIEANNNEINLNITIDGDIRGDSDNKDVEPENRSPRRNQGLLDIIKILLIRELIGRPGCNRPNCRPGPRPPMPPYPPRPPYPRYDFDEFGDEDNRYLRF